MFKTTIDNCSGCGYKLPIANKKHKLCMRCNSLRIKKSKPKQRSEVEVYTNIWNSRKHECELTGVSLSKYLNTKLWFNCFAHLNAKGKYPGLKYNENNILLVDPEVHYLIDFGTRDKLISFIGQKSYEKLTQLRENALNDKSRLLE